MKGVKSRSLHNWLFYNPDESKAAKNGGDDRINLNIYNTRYASALSRVYNQHSDGECPVPYEVMAQLSDLKATIIL